MTMTPEQLEAELKSVTDQVKYLDDLINGEKSMFFRCSHSGLLFPADYVKEWGRVYGIGLGPEPVSECLDTQYYIAPPDPRFCPTLEDYMHPFGVTKAQIDFVMLPTAAPHNMLILEKDDPKYNKRKVILREKQLNNPISKIFNLTTEQIAKIVSEKE